MAELRIGISGWSYAPWRGKFFPKGLARTKELAFASRQVNAIEINSTFYSFQRPATYASWAEQTPPGFVFAIKGPKLVTHIHRLAKAEIPLANFFASGVLRLGEKLGPILWQLPPSLAFDADRLGAFLQLLPRNTDSALQLARQHDGSLPHGTWLEAGPNRPMRHALEVRHASFQNAGFIDLLRWHDIALVVADTAGHWPRLEDVTADFIYVRLHGGEELYVSGYDAASLAAWAEKVRAWHHGGDAVGAQLSGPMINPRAEGRDVYVFFDNSIKPLAPYDAMSLARLLGLPAPAEVDLALVRAKPKARPARQPEFPFMKES